MNKLVIAALAATAASLGTCAFAADLPVKAPMAAAPVFTWAGLYGGVHGGYGWGDYKFNNEFGPNSGSADPKGGFGGLQLGYNGYIAPNWVLGSEVDFSWGDIRDTGSSTIGPNTVSTKIDFFGTARTRLGYAFDRTLIYATGGMAWAHVKASLFLPFAGVDSFAADTYFAGWTAGGGLEYAYDPRWSVKIEYLYADLGDYRQMATGATRTHELTLNTVKLGLNHRFGDPAPAASALPVKARPAAWTWNGSYIGAYGGYGWSDLHEIDNTSLTTANLDPKGWFGGFQTGYNWQFAPNWLFGVEAEDAFSSIKDNGFAQPGASPATGKIDQFGSMRARLGYVVDRSLIYATGGFAWAHLKFATSFSEWNTYEGGWTIGGGLEYAIDAKWSAKVEYLYADYGRRTDRLSSVGGLATTLTTSTVKAGLNYKFDLGELLRGR